VRPDQTRGEARADHEARVAAASNGERCEELHPNGAETAVWRRLPLRPGKRISRCDRRSRTKVWCHVEFFAGDVGWDGRTSIWYSRNRRGVAVWNYSYKITRTNYYCLDVGNENCTKTLRVR